MKEHLISFGGHPGAAGLTIERPRLQSFRQAINRVAAERLDPKALAPAVVVDAQLPLGDITQEFMRQMEALAPFGMGNPWPVFLSKNARLAISKRPDDFDPRGIRFAVEDDQGQFFEAIQLRESVERLGLYVGKKERLKGRAVTLAYSPVYRKEEDGFGIELKVRDLWL